MKSPANRIPYEMPSDLLSAPPGRSGPPKIKLSPAGEFSLGGINFVVDLSPGNERRLSDDRAFTIVKHEAYLQIYERLALSLSPHSILELGIFQGGSYVLIDKLFRPQCMSALDISSVPVAPLLNYLKDKSGRFAHFGTSQTDTQSLSRIVQDDLSGRIDLVIDDASHTYRETRTAFEFLFPLLSPGGVYVIEDWSWAHCASYQAPSAAWNNRPALTNLLFEQIMLLGSTASIAEIRIWKPLYLIQKSMAPDSANTLPKSGRSIFDQIKARGKEWSPI